MNVQGENITAIQGVVPFAPSTSPSLWVEDDEQFDEAQQHMAEILDRAAQKGTETNWKCVKCGELVGAQFTACWNCETERGNTPLTAIADSPQQHDDSAGSDEEIAEEHTEASVPTPAKSVLEVALEVGAVLTIAVIPDVFFAIWDVLFQTELDNRLFAKDHFFYIVRALQVSAPTLYLMWRSGERWSSFGITRPMWFADFLLGFALWLVCLVGWSFVGGMLPISFLEYHENFASGTVQPVSPRPAFELLLLLVSSCANGFAEELVMRAYLIPRFERLLRSTWKSVLLTAALFAVYHVYQGFIGFANALVVGIVFGTAYCWVRRLWPLAIAHAVGNLIVGL